MNGIRVYDSEMSMKWNNEAWSIPEISAYEEKTLKEMGYTSFKKKRGWKIEDRRV